MPAVRVRLYAGLQGLVGQREVELSLAPGATVEQLRWQVASEYPALEALISTLAVAVNDEMATMDYVIAGGDRLELIPPIAGGSGDRFSCTITITPSCRAPTE
jgi:molybdopterin converting factor small subunit